MKFLIVKLPPLWRYIPEGSNLHSRRRENLKSEIYKPILGCVLIIFIDTRVLIKKNVETTVLGQGGYSVLLGNIGICLHVHTALHPRRPTLTSSPA
jgi:hypothetical protein